MDTAIARSAAHQRSATSCSQLANGATFLAKFSSRRFGVAVVIRGKFAQFVVGIRFAYC
jgi:hypothetical protein